MKALLFLLLLAGCATRPEVRTPIAYEVDKVVAVSCVKATPMRPTYDTEHLPATATDLQFGDALAVDWVRSRGYEKELEAVVAACVK
jgi:hypothetical protein